MVVAFILLVLNALLVELSFFCFLPLSATILSEITLVRGLPIIWTLASSDTMGLNLTSVLVWQLFFTIAIAGITWFHGGLEFWRNNLLVAIIRSSFDWENTRSRIAVVLLFVVALQSLACFETLMLTGDKIPNRRDYDAIVYHFPMTCHWIQEGAISPYESTDPHTWCSPINYEVLLTWYCVLSEKNWSWAHFSGFWPVLSLCLVLFILHHIRKPSQMNLEPLTGTIDRIEKICGRYGELPQFGLFQKKMQSTSRPILPDATFPVP